MQSNWANFKSYGYAITPHKKERGPKLKRILLLCNNKNSHGPFSKLTIKFILQFINPKTQSVIISAHSDLVHNRRVLKISAA